jgi:hypothetical protein
MGWQPFTENNTLFAIDEQRTKRAVFALAEKLIGDH